ncbi:hypothetical protein [Streptomyces sp. NPDC002676]
MEGRWKVVGNPSGSLHDGSGDLDDGSGSLHDGLANGRQRPPRAS